MIREILQKISKLFEKPTDEPKQWKCCSQLVRPSELAQHYRDNHMGVRN